MDKLDILKQYFGYDEFRYPQEEIIESVLAGNDTIAILPTGFGKSVTFQVPALLFLGITIVISPLIALMEDQKKNLVKHGIRAAVLHSNLENYEQEQIFQQIQKKKIKILYVSPERLMNPFFKQKIKKEEIPFLVVDEAHTILWAEGFRSAFAHICDFISELPKRPRILALTATATTQTIEKIKAYLKLSNPNLIHIGVDRPNLYYRVASPKNKLGFLLKYIARHQGQKGIIYCLTRKKTEELFFQLSECAISCAYYHGGLDIEIKKYQQEAFSNGQVDVMICTNAFGMGIDIKDIRFVIHYELPNSLLDLMQQMGRAARDGGTAEGIVLFSFEDIKTNDFFIYSLDDEQIRKEKKRQLDAVVDYCLSRKCRHQRLAAYFGQKINRCNYFCDNCKKKWTKYKKEHKINIEK